MDAEGVQKVAVIGAATVRPGLAAGRMLHPHRRELTLGPAAHDEADFRLTKNR